jgi:RNA polymerase sigma-70 factor (ECF subfamily)
VNEPDQDLVRAAAAGNLRAFEELVRAYQGPVWRFLCRLLHDAALAEDITQETFVRVYKRLDGFRAGSRFTTWLFQVARNAGIDAIRARSRRERLLVRYGSDTSANPPPDERLDLETALATVSPLLREAIVLIEVVGMSYEEAAAVSRVPVGTVKSRVFHARRRLAGLLEDKSEDESEDES